jgi:very-short-patch-repair endonuclease
VSKAPRRRDPRIRIARRLRREMTDAERRIWWRIRELPIERSHFRRQATIGSYIVDFACHELRLVIEIDGGGHAEQDQMIADAARTRDLESRGYRVLRFWNHEVLRETDAVMQSILDAAQAAAAATARGE